MLSGEYEGIVGLRLSNSIKSNIDRYCKSFESCEHKLNKDDIASFVLSFSKMVVSAMKDTRASSKKRQQILQGCTVLMRRLAGGVQGKGKPRATIPTIKLDPAGVSHSRSS